MKFDPQRFSLDFWYISPLMHRILAANVTALLLLMMGLLYTGEYERGLIQAGLKALSAEGRLVAAAVEAGGLNDITQRMIGDMGQMPGVHVAVFNSEGRLIFETRDWRDLPYATPPPPARFSLKGVDKMPRLGLPEFTHVLSDKAVDYPDVSSALSGKAASGAWKGRDGRVLLTAALPVEKNAHVAAVFIMRAGGDLDAAVSRVQTGVLMAFFLALLGAVLLTIYLSKTIVSPLVRLAEGTRLVRQSILLKDAVPDFSQRNDEIGNLSHAFRDMTSALADRIDAISHFASDVAHEIKNPLASLKSAVETFPLAQTESQRQSLLSVMHDDINRINRLITDISNASRLDSELSRAERMEIDIVRLLRSVVETERARIGDNKKIFMFIDTAHRLTVMGNDVQLAQVVHNLIDNAVSFSPPHGQVTIRIGVQKNHLFLYVDNPGPPIPEDKKEAIFERFYSERPRTEKFGLHSGLGLSISRQIVRMHQGEIFAQNQKNKAGEAEGVRFVVLLPLVSVTK